MEKEQKNNPIITLLFLLIIAVGLGFAMKKAIDFGLKYYNDYWRDNNVSYWFDLRHFGIENIDPQKYKTKDESLREDALMLMRSCIEHDKDKRTASGITISDKYYNMLCPDNSLQTPERHWSDLSSFLVLQYEDKAIVLFEFTVVPTELEKAERCCINSYKPRSCNRLYLERIDGKWTASNVLIVE